MKQIVQNLQNGETMLAEVPVPVAGRGQLLIRTHCSLVSLGTERMLVEFGKAGWIEKARQQPEKVRQVLDKIKADGLQPTLEAVFRKLGEPLPLGYCNAGEVIAVGEGVTGFRVGDRVLSNGKHAEVVCVPQNLAAHIPDGLPYEDATFAVVGAIALQGIRLIEPTFGETVVVTGLGLIGLLAAQLLRANGCKVVGLDFDPVKLELARSWGIQAFQAGDGPAHQFESSADAVLITASTKSNEVVSQAARMCRKRGRIVLVGVVGLDLQRSDFYEKELRFQVSCSYGPGRYDESYEIKGQDYPIGFVRWTAQRNFEAVLQAMASGQIQVKPLITEVVDLQNYKQIYRDIGQTRSIASILRYPVEQALEKHPFAPSEGHFSGQRGSLGIIGAGNFAAATILPNLRKLGADMRSIASASGLSSAMLAKKYGIPQATGDYRDILADPNIDAVIIATRHNAHARLAAEALRAGKHVFVEKPLALNNPELHELETTLLESGRTLMVGFNRRFSPFAREAKELLGNDAGSMHVVATMNAGAIPANNWVHDPEIGGGRLIGEACHLIDLITFFTGSFVENVVANALGPQPATNTDNASILLQYANGSTGVINYFSNGNTAYPKERIEVYNRGRTIVIDNFRRARYFGFPKSGRSQTQDKGHHEQFARWLERLKNGGTAPIPAAELWNTSRAAIAAVTSLQQRQWISL